VAPRLDEHRDEVLGEAVREPASRRTLTASEAAPLEDVKILDLFWVLAGPGGTRMLADYGATVVHVESATHVDTLRVIPPYHYSNPHLECSGAFQSANANKLGISLDLASDEGREIVLDLVRWADVVTESFAPGVVDHCGLGYEALRKVNPKVIMISSCLMGQTGPWRTFTGFGNLAATVTGFQQLASWPDRPPSGPYGAYTDFIAVRYNALAILAALEYRERSGQGQYIDQSQAEAALHFLAPAFLDYTVNGRVPGAVGNDDGDLFPHGMFEAAGEDCWVAIAVRDDVEWAALCEVIGREDLVERREERPVVEAAICDWTRSRAPGEIEAALQARGVPVHEALDMTGLFEDPQIQERGHFLTCEHSIFPTTTVESTRLRLSRSPAKSPERALSVGRDNRLVLETLLGYAPERIDELLGRDVLR
jgi:crotonobetainyl-CoA:carnitine CoA-transferase CaiB-like acyl-CoA transferase